MKKNALHIVFLFSIFFCFFGVGSVLAQSWASGWEKATTYDIDIPSDTGIVMFADGSTQQGAGNTSIQLKIDGVAVDTVTIDDVNDNARRYPFALFYSTTTVSGAVTLSVTSGSALQTVGIGYYYYPLTDPSGGGGSSATTTVVFDDEAFIGFYVFFGILLFLAVLYGVISVLRSFTQRQ